MIRQLLLGRWRLLLLALPTLPPFLAFAELVRSIDNPLEARDIFIFRPATLRTLHCYT